VAFLSVYEKLQDRSQATPTPELAGTPATAHLLAPRQAKSKPGVVAQVV
jgi:hypothetical protein